LAWLQQEPTGDLVEQLLAFAGGYPGETHFPQVLGLSGPRPTVLLNLISLGEVFYIIARRRGTAEASDVTRRIRRLPIEVVQADESLVIRAATIKAENRVSYADAFAIATAQAMDSILFTGDPEIRSVAGVEVFWMGADR